MKKIAIYGGAFDPPHLGHVLSLTNVLNSKLVDEIRLTPSGEGRYDKKPFESTAHRIEMLNLLIKTEFSMNNQIKLELCQVKNKNDPGYTIELLDYLKDLHKDCSFYFIIGEDNLNDLISWKDSERLIKEYHFIVLPRGSNVQTNMKIGSNFIFLNKGDCISCDVSSTKIRSLIQSNSLTSGLLPVAVRDYIAEKRLYS